MYGYILTLQGEGLSSVFSPDGTYISASAAPHCGTQKRGEGEGKEGGGSKKNKRWNEGRGKNVNAMVLTGLTQQITFITMALPSEQPASHP